jgi:hypothetical protein
VARGAVRGAVTAWLGLIVLQVVTTKHGSGQIAGLFGVADSVVKRAMSPDVAAIPDYRNGAPAASSTSSATDPKLPTPAPTYTTVGGRIPVPTGTAGTTTRPL